jgi:glycosyltransferase involved in cell wall biosynthesis
MRILWIPHAGWHTPQRARLFCRALAVRHEVHVTDLAADFAKPRDFFSKRYLQNFFERQTQDGKISVHGVPRIAPAFFLDPIMDWNDRRASKLIERLIDHHAIDVVLGTFVSPPPQAPRLIFDLFDDNPALWIESGIAPRYADRIRAAEQKYLQQADAVIAVSRVLAERAMEQGARSVHYLPNGIDIPRYQQADRSLWRSKLNLEGHVIGLIGNHDRWDEMDKVLQAAARLQHQPLTFLIAGRGAAMDRAKQMAAQNSLPHLRFHAAFTADDAPGIVSAIDVGLCPYRRTPGADARSPMRLLEYSALGKPVVCTDLNEVRRMNFENVLLVEDNAEALADGITRALTTTPVVPAALQGYDLARLTAQLESILRGEA